MYKLIILLNIKVYKKLNNPMNSATSQVEKHFQIHNVYKRSKHLYDI